MPPNVGAVIVAAGQSTRTGDIDKIWAPVAGPDGRSRPLLAFAVDPFESSAAVNRLVLVVAETALERARSLVQAEGWKNVCAVVQGGSRRQDSVRAGLEALGDCVWVIVHDGARPLVTRTLIERGLESARETSAACCAVPAPDTVKESADGERVERTLERSRLWLAQTPQVFRYDLLLEAHRNTTDEVTDDAALVEALGVDVQLFPGAARNMKVTTTEDLTLAKALLQLS